MARQALVTLEQWLTEAFNDPDKRLPNDPKTRARPIAVTLLHLPSEKEIHGSPFPAETTWSVEEIQILAKRLRGIASTDCQEMNGIQRYRVYVLYEGSSVPQARYQFDIAGKLLPTDADGGGGEEPTATGRAMQRMRVDDALTSTFVVGNREMVNQLAAINRQQGEQLITLMNRNMEMFNAFQQFAMDRINEERRIKAEELAAMQNAADRAALMKLAPALINTMSGKNVFPQETEDTALIESIASGMTRENLAMLGMLPGLPPTVLAAVTARFEKIIATREANEKHLRQLTSPNESQNGGSALAKLEVGDDDGREPLQ